MYKISVYDNVTNTIVGSGHIDYYEWNWLDGGNLKIVIYRFCQDIFDDSQDFKAVFYNTSPSLVQVGEALYFHTDTKLRIEIIKCD